jgi:hypothetical protein
MVHEWDAATTEAAYQRSDSLVEDAVIDATWKVGATSTADVARAACAVVYAAKGYTADTDEDPGVEQTVDRIAICIMDILERAVGTHHQTASNTKRS